MSQRASLGSRRRAASGGSILSSWWSKVRKRTRSRASSTRSAPNASPSAHSIPRALGATSPISFHSHSSDSSQVPAPRLALLFDGAYNPPPRFDPSVILFGPVPSILPALKRLHNFPTSSSCEVGNLHPSGNTASPARVPPNLRFISLSKPLFSPYPETQLDLSHAQVERFTVREALGSGRGYALLQLAEPGGSMYTLRLEHGKFENGDEGAPNSAETDCSDEYLNSITAADIAFGKEQPFIDFLHTLDALVQKWEFGNKWGKRHGTSLSFALWMAKQLAEHDSEWGEDLASAWVQENSPIIAHPVGSSHQDQCDEGGVPDDDAHESQEDQVTFPEEETEEMEPVILETPQMVLSDGETASEHSAHTPSTPLAPLDDDIAHYLKALVLFEGGTPPDVEVIS